MEKRNIKLLLWIETTEHCQIRCRFCYNSWRNISPSQHKHMSLDTVKDIVCFAKREFNDYNITCALAGGDLTAHPDWRELVSLFSEIGDIFIVTHGAGLEEDDFPLLRESKSEIQFSIPSLQPESYKFHTGGALLNDALLSLARAKYFNLRTSVSVVVTAENLSEISEFIELGGDLNLSYIVFNKFMPAGRGVHYNERFSLDNESFLRCINSAREKNNDRTKLLVSGSFPGVRERKNLHPKLTISREGDIQICSLVSSSIGKVSSDGGPDVMAKYKNFWSGSSSILGCECSNRSGIS